MSIIASSITDSSTICSIAFVLISDNRSNYKVSQNDEVMKSFHYMFLIYAKVWMDIDGIVGKRNGKFDMILLTFQHSNSRLREFWGLHEKAPNSIGYWNVRYHISLYIKAETNWPSFCRRHLQMHFLEWKSLYFDSNFTSLLPWVQLTICHTALDNDLVP